MRTRIPLITTIVAALLLIPAAASAALVDEQRQGQNLVAQLNAGTKTCGDLTGDDLDHIGEYVMFKALGSNTLHQAMNDRMSRMMGEQAETRMHQLLGARYADCSARGLAIAGYGSMMGATLAVVLVLLAILAITHRWPFRRPPVAAPPREPGVLAELTQRSGLTARHLPRIRYDT